MRVNCSTCLELLTPGDSLVCTPCGHVFHVQCVLQWFESKKNCPQCRHPSNEKNIRKIYLSDVGDEEAVNADDLQNKLDNAQFSVRSLNTEKETYKTKFKEVSEHNSKLKEEIKKIELSRRKAEDSTKEYIAQIRFWKDERDRFEQFQQDAEKYKRELDKFTLIKKVLHDSVGEVNLFLHERGSFDKESKDLATLIVQLKKKLVELKRQKSLADKKAEEATYSKDDLRNTIKSQSIQISELKTHNELIGNELKVVNEQVHAIQEENEKLKVKTEQQEKNLKKIKENVPVVSDDDLFDMEEEEENLSFMDSPAVALKSCGIMIGEKRKPLTEVRNEPVVKRPKCRMDLLQIGTQKSSGGLNYDGMGGRSRPDVFPAEPMRKFKKPVRRTSNVSTKVQKQRQIMDKYFGSFDSP